MHIYGGDRPRTGDHMTTASLLVLFALLSSQVEADGILLGQQGKDTERGKRLSAHLDEEAGKSP